MAELPGEPQELLEMLHLTSCMASAPASLCSGHLHAFDTPTWCQQGQAAPVAACAALKGLVPFRSGSQWGPPSSHLWLWDGQFLWTCHFPALSPERAALALVISLPGMQEASGASESCCLQWAGRQGASAQPLFGAGGRLLPTARDI